MHFVNGLPPVTAFIAILSMCIRVVVRGLPFIFLDLATLVLQSAN